MNRKKQKNKQIVNLVLVPEWKYRLLLSRLDKQSKEIAYLYEYTNVLSHSVKLLFECITEED